MPNNSISYLLPLLKMKRRAWMVKSENTTNANQHKYNQLAWFSFRRDELCQYYYILSQSRWLSYIQSIKLLKIQMTIWYHEYAFIFVRIFQFIIKALARKEEIMNKKIKTLRLIYIVEKLSQYYQLKLIPYVLLIKAIFQYIVPCR